MDPELIALLRDDLTAAGYGFEAVRGMLGAEADEARSRGAFAPARRVLAERDRSPLATLIRLLLLGDELGAEELDAALPRLATRGAERLGLVSAVGEVARDEWRAALSLNAAGPIGSVRREWWILSDLDDQLRRGPARPDHVMGVGAATRSLIAQAPLLGSGKALDLGTGCGIVALVLAEGRPGGTVVATDISARALDLARANAILNGIAGIDFRRGDLFAPVAGERFDLILSNPPFVITPRRAGAAVYEYRDGGMAGDGLAERAVREGPDHLVDGGMLLCLANWETPWGGNGLERVRGWILDAARASGPLEAWVIERDRVTPERYAETWARDGGARPGSVDFEELMSDWLDDFAARRIVSIGLGSVRVRRASATAMLAEESIVHIEQAIGSYADESLGALLAETFDAGVAAQRMTPDEILAAHWLRAEAVAEERRHRPGEEAPSAITLMIDAPIARRVSADPLLAAAVGACDGELRLCQIADALATLLELDAGAVSEALVHGVRELAWLGMLAPAGRLDD